MSEYAKMLERMQGMTNDDLQKMVYVEFEDYTDVALEAAREVLRERGIEKSLEDQMAVEKSYEELVTFQDFFMAADFKLVEGKLYSLFKESDDVVSKMGKVYAHLMRMKPSKQEGVYMFLAQTKEDFSRGYPFDVFAIEEGEEDFFSLEMFAWNDWLSLSVMEKSKDLIFKLGIDEFVAICLRKMTTYGFTEEEVEAKIEEIMNASEAFDETFEE